MKSKKRIIFLLFCVLSGCITYSQTVISVSDFGAKSNSFENASPGVCKALEASKQKENVILKLPGGRIDLWPDGAVKRELYISNTTEADTLSKVKNIGFWIEGFNNLTIEGNNTLVVLHGKMVSFAIVNSKNITIRNVSFDYERPTMSELKLTSVTEKSIEALIHPDSKYAVDNGKFFFYGEGWKSISLHTILYEPDKEIMKYSSFKPFQNSKATETSPLNVRFDGDFSKTKFRKDDILTIRDPYRDNCGAFISLSKNIQIGNMKMHYMHGLGIVSQFSENISLVKVACAPRENSGRIISCFADCFHFSGCRGKIRIDSCYTSGSHDDPINVHGTHLKITGISDNGKLTVRFMHHQTYGFEAFFAGDSIAFVNPQTLQPFANAVIKSAISINKREMGLELEGTLPKGVEPNQVIENLTWTPEVTIQNCRFERTSTRGLLLTTRKKILIENNTFFRTGMHAILIADDAASWFESGMVHDVTIRNNTFSECGFNSSPGNYVVAIAPENHQLVKGFYVHRNIRIENNTFKVYDYPLVTARSVENFIFTGNKIIMTDFMPKGKKQAEFNLTACSGVSILKNTFETGELPEIKADIMIKKNIKTDIATIFQKE